MKPEYVGDYIKQRRLNLGLSQIDVAKIIGVSDETIRQWENNTYKPLIRFYPKIIKFLTFVPLPKPISFREKLRFCRHVLGMTQKQFAQLVNYSSDTVSSWETNEYEPTEYSLKLLNRIMLPILNELVK